MSLNVTESMKNLSTIENKIKQINKTKQQLIKKETMIKAPAELKELEHITDTNDFNELENRVINLIHSNKKDKRIAKQSKQDKYSIKPVTSITQIKGVTSYYPLAYYLTRVPFKRILFDDLNKKSIPLSYYKLLPSNFNAGLISNGCHAIKSFDSKFSHSAVHKGMTFDEFSNICTKYVSNVLFGLRAYYFKGMTDKDVEKEYKIVGISGFNHNVYIIKAFNAYFNQDMLPSVKGVAIHNMRRLINGIHEYETTDKSGIQVGNKFGISGLTHFLHNPQVIQMYNLIYPNNQIQLRK